MRRVVWIMAFFVIWGIVPGLVLAQASEPPSNTLPPGETFTRTLQLGETLTCWAQRSGAHPGEIALANGLLNPALAPALAEVRLPSPALSITLLPAAATDTPLALAFKQQIPLWQFLRLNPQPLYAGATVRLPAAASPQPTCLPYPLTALAWPLAPQARGRTAVLTLETREPAICAVTYLSQTEACHTEDGRHMYAFLGVSALQEPGTYPLRLSIKTAHHAATLNLALEVEKGDYGFQRIMPPDGLSGLMDSELMNGELEYLAFWRQIRGARREWQFPLDFPLPYKVPISAGYGDRRSYGGIVDGYHSGIDYRASGGMAVRAPATGTVILAEKLRVRGNAVLLDHGWGLVTGYWHLSRIEVKVGDVVTRGETFARVGSTGLSTGAHLHWDVWINGVAVDGRQWLDPEGLGITFADPLPVRYPPKEASISQ